MLRELPLVATLRPKATRTPGTGETFIASQTAPPTAASRTRAPATVQPRCQGTRADGGVEAPPAPYQPPATGSWFHPERPPERPPRFAARRRAGRIGPTGR